ncbi:MAG: acyltransferase [gamma proteobacterium symbiont of Bathyaustriella thionipta]|nr:acyltransferase [gamma proteobacterium symbiont of Bathyaustriella thionipta]MCU7949558.1 acyltransferase [gamma proteobacterium symbiont of Bathyaustriella thionipta]MCU7952954.1 acyltransferase [gamma proteobacterium symbiont of Bathyaustriella thionipta]MCU7956150.1 acyltransferase [gamma proteobacterium symbiont of Bathyaustriella thionipta]MCU7967942.1 acyltransferase [gamma proteobacterium symbiont of Bathyaustriella thionipta]
MNRNTAVDILKIVLAFMVIGIHADFLADITLMGNYLTVNGIFRIAVPLFLVISGFYFYPLVSKKIYPVWFKRILYLYLFWMLFYIYFWFRPSEFSMSEITKIIQTLMIGFNHLWFLPGLLGGALLVVLTKDLSTRTMLLMIVMTFIGGVIIQYAGNYHWLENSEIDKWFNLHWVHRNFVFIGFPFFCLGYLIHKLNIHEKISVISSLILSVIGFFFLILESYLNYIEPLREGGFDNLGSLLIICPAVFLLFMKLDFQGKSKELALYSVGIYFIHILFINIYRKIFDFDETLLTLVVILSSIAASFFLIKINKKMKFIL